MSAAEIAALPFESALKELEQTVKRLEIGDIPLEEAIDAYTRGTQLKQHCQKKLEDARLKVEKLVKGADGSMVGVPFEET